MIHSFSPVIEVVISSAPVYLNLFMETVKNQPQHRFLPMFSLVLFTEPWPSPILGIDPDPFETSPLLLLFPRSHLRVCPCIWNTIKGGGERNIISIMKVLQGMKNQSYPNSWEAWQRIFQRGIFFITLIHYCRGLCNVYPYGEQHGSSINLPVSDELMSTTLIKWKDWWELEAHTYSDFYFVIKRAVSLIQFEDHFYFIFLAIY